MGRCCRAILDFLANTGVGGELRCEETRCRDDFPFRLPFRYFLCTLSFPGQARAAGRGSYVQRAIHPQQIHASIGGSNDPLSGHMSFDNYSSFDPIFWLHHAARRPRITIFSDAQAAIKRMASDEPGPSQQYALQARKHIATLRKARPGISIEIRWCPAHKGVAGNEKADEWAKVAAEEPDTRGVEWLNYDYGGRSEVRATPLPRSLANFKREISEKKWAEACQWAGGRTSKAKYRTPKSQKPDGAVAGSAKRLASRFYQIKTGHCLTGQ